MSHVVKLDIEINDLDALKKACPTLGLEFMENQQKYKWFGHSVGDYPIPEGVSEKDLGKCDHAIRVKDNKKSYEVGVVKNKVGSGYTMLWDFWQGGFGLQKSIGNNGSFLRQQYAKEVVKKQLPRGFRITEKQKDNKIVLELTR